MSDYCCLIVFDTGPTLIQHWANVLCLLGGKGIEKTSILDTIPVTLGKRHGHLSNFDQTFYGAALYGSPSRVIPTLHSLTHSYYSCTDIVVKGDHHSMPRWGGGIFRPGQIIYINPSILNSLYEII